MKTARLRDLVLLLLTGCSFSLCIILVAGKLWFESLFESALDRKTVEAALFFAAITVATGAGYVFSKPPSCQKGDDRGIKGSA